MRRRINGIWVWAAFFALGAMSALGGDACAKGITITIGQMPGGGEPPYDYIIQVYLDPGFEVASSNSFTVENLIGVTPPNFPNTGDVGSLTIQPENGSTVVWSPTITQAATPPTPYPYAGNVQWSFYGSPPIMNTGSSELYLGQFVVETTVDFSSPPYVIGAPIDYKFTILNASGQAVTGSGVALLGVPEPSSAILLLIGAGMVPLAVTYRSQRRRLRRA